MARHAGRTLRGLHLVVSDIDKASTALIDRGTAVGPVEDSGGVRYAPFAAQAAIPGPSSTCPGAHSTKAVGLSTVTGQARREGHPQRVPPRRPWWPEARRRLAEVYASKYQWQVTVRDGALWGDGAPTAGPPPYDVYVITPTAAFGFGTDKTFGATRWRF